MQPTPVVRTALFGLVAIVVIAMTLGFGVLHTDDLDPQVRFSLQDHTGTPVTEQTFRGQYLLAYFGFTHCPKVCPMQMAKLTQVMQQLDGLGLAAQITPVFISVDPERDTVEQVSAYLDHFHERFVGLTGSREALERTARSFKSYVATRSKGDDDHEDISHTSVFYIVDPNGGLVDHIPANAAVDDAVYRTKEHIL